MNATPKINIHFASEFTFAACGNKVIGVNGAYGFGSFTDIFQQSFFALSTECTRLIADLLPAKAVIGHKTGTGFTTPLGGITALNDCGYVNLPDGRHYSIAVFIADSPYSTQATAKIIADISSIVLSVLSLSSTQNRNL